MFFCDDGMQKHGSRPERVMHVNYVWIEPLQARHKRRRGQCLAAQNFHDNPFAGQGSSPSLHCDGVA